MEYYSTFLCTAAALHAGRDCSPQAEGAPEQSQAQGFTESTTLMRVPAQLSAMHLFNREHHNIHELLQWAIQASPDLHVAAQQQALCCWTSAAARCTP